MPNVYTYKEDEHVRCPYYKRESPTEVRCAGLSGRTQTTNTFRTKADKEDFKEDFCNGFYWNCSLYRALEEDGV